eukprot:g9610.t1
MPDSLIDNNISQTNKRKEDATSNTPEGNTDLQNTTKGNTQEEKARNQLEKQTTSEKRAKNINIVKTQVRSTRTKKLIPSKHLPPQDAFVSNVTIIKPTNIVSDEALDKLIFPRRCKKYTMIAHPAVFLFKDFINEFLVHDEVFECQYLLDEVSEVPFPLEIIVTVRDGMLQLLLNTACFIQFDVVGVQYEGPFCRPVDKNGKRYYYKVQFDLRADDFDIRNRRCQSVFNILCGLYMKRVKMNCYSTALDRKRSNKIKRESKKIKQNEDMVNGDDNNGKESIVNDNSNMNGAVVTTTPAAQPSDRTTTDGTANNNTLNNTNHARNPDATKSYVSDAVSKSTTSNNNYKNSSSNFGGNTTIDNVNSLSSLIHTANNVQRFNHNPMYNKQHEKTQQQEQKDTDAKTIFRYYELIEDAYGNVVEGVSRPTGNATDFFTVEFVEEDVHWDSKIVHSSVEKMTRQFTLEKEERRSSVITLPEDKANKHNIKNNVLKQPDRVGTGIGHSDVNNSSNSTVHHPTDKKSSSKAKKMLHKNKSKNKNNAKNAKLNGTKAKPAENAPGTGMTGDAAATKPSTTIEQNGTNASTSKTATEKNDTDFDSNVATQIELSWIPSCLEWSIPVLSQQEKPSIDDSAHKFVKFKEWCGYVSLHNKNVHSQIWPKIKSKAGAFDRLKSTTTMDSGFDALIVSEMQQDTAIPSNTGLVDEFNRLSKDVNDGKIPWSVVSFDT